MKHETETREPTKLELEILLEALEEQRHELYPHPENEEYAAHMRRIGEVVDALKEFE